MLMPSLAPLLKPWMMRPRAGQRNSGLASGATAPAASAFGGKLAVGCGSTPAFTGACWILPNGAASILAALIGSVFAAFTGSALAVFAAGVVLTAAALPGFAAAMGLPFKAAGFAEVEDTASIFTIFPPGPLTSTYFGCAAAIFAGAAGLPCTSATCCFAGRPGAAAAL